MAKLSVRGRRELVRLARITISKHERGSETRRSTVALMSDRTVLEKIDITFPATWSAEAGRQHQHMKHRTVFGGSARHHQRRSTT